MQQRMKVCADASHPYGIPQFYFINSPYDTILDKPNLYNIGNQIPVQP